METYTWRGLRSLLSVLEFHYLVVIGDECFGSLGSVFCSFHSRCFLFFDPFFFSVKTSGQSKG